MDLDFFLQLLNALVLADLLNEVGNRVRPYEVLSGETDRVLAEVTEELHDAMCAPVRARPPVRGSLRMAGRLLEQVWSRRLVRMLRSARRKLDAIQVDRLRVKPVVKITGEIWAQTTEGDGNYRLFSFLEQENAQVLTEPIASWIGNVFHTRRLNLVDRKGIQAGMAIPTWSRPLHRLRVELGTLPRLVPLIVATRAFRREYERMRRALGGSNHGLVDPAELVDLARPWYSSRLRGGEGHMEVGKNLYYHRNGLCHMVISVKPFGCMPSTQSDGVQAAVLHRHRDMIFLPVETSGEGEVNAHSRVQMALGEARDKAQREFDGTVERWGYPLEQLREHVRLHAELRRALAPVPPVPRIAGEAASFVAHVAQRMRAEGVEPWPLDTARSG
jgi:predicted nucleotide-binding protein (sugar kinase/HSP70/actin superfamily)